MPIQVDEVDEADQTFAKSIELKYGRLIVKVDPLETGSKQATWSTVGSIAELYAFLPSSTWMLLRRTTDNNSYNNCH